MVSLIEQRGLWSNSTMLNKVSAALVEEAVAIGSSDSSSPPASMTWARNYLAAADGNVDTAWKVMIAQNSSLNSSDILSAPDSSVQTAANASLVFLIESTST